MDNFDISKYLNMAVKRKWWIIITFLFSILGGLTYLLITPKVYEAKTLILIQGQTVPEDYVRPVVNSSVDDRLNTISQQVTSRTNSEKIINDYGLYSSRSGMSIDEKVALFIARIEIDTSKDRNRRNAETSAFTITFQDENPKKVKDVTNALASNYIDEHLNMRAEEALGTANFLIEELDNIEKDLKQKEEERRQYREKYMGGLPEQLDTNLSILEGLHSQMDQLNNNLRDAENRKTTIINNIALAREAGAPISGSSQGQFAGEVNNLASLKRELDVLQSRYTSNHPDVIRLKETISRLEDERKKAKLESDESSDEDSIAIESVNQTLKRQLEEVNLRISTLNAGIKETQSQIDYYKKMVADTPKRDQELIEINRDYDILQAKYDSYKNKQIDAGIAVKMEKVQKGEQFKIIDYAKVPEHPVKPDVKKIILMTFALGFGLGCGIAYLLEMMDTSYKTPDEAGGDLDIPVLASIPLLTNEMEIRLKKRKDILITVCVSLGFCIALFSILASVKGVDTTLEYVKGVFG